MKLKVDKSLPNGWSAGKLGNVLPLSYGKSLVEEKRDSEGQVPVFGSSGIVGHHSRALVDNPTLIIGRKGNVGAVFYSEEPCWVIDTAYFVSNTSSLYLKFFRYLMEFIQLGRLDRSTAVPGLSRNDYNEVVVPIPPQNEQERIVSEIEKQFTRLDVAVAALKRVQANLKRYRAAVLKDACEGRLVPTEAELARRENRSYEPASVLLERILLERRSRWEAAQLAKVEASDKITKDQSWKLNYKEPIGPKEINALVVPEGWVPVSWNQIAFSQNGRAFPSSEYCEGGIKLLRPGNLYSNGSVGWTAENTRHLPEKWATDFPEFIVGAGEVVMNLTAQSLKDEFLGRACLTGINERCLLNQRIARLKPILIHSKYLLYVLKSQIFRRFVNGLNTGSLIQHMFTSQLDEFVFSLPPFEEQKRIFNELERKLSVIEEIEGQIDSGFIRAERLRQSILKSAFEGRLVPQDPADESANILLERIRSDRNAAHESSPTKPQRRRKKEATHVS